MIGARIAPGFAVALSGAAGLAYQVAWTRRLATTTTATVTAQAIVLAVFMAGLGAGALLGGGVAPRLRRPLLAYAAVEAGALLLAAGSVPLIAAAPALPLPLHLALLSIYLFVPTTLMGATLPLVVEHLERRDPAGARASAAWIYGLNTAGAVAGCIAAGYVAVERLGLSATTLAGASLAAGAALVAAFAGRSCPPHLAVVRPAARGAPRDVPLLAAAFLSGAVGLAAEVLWTRLVSLVVLNTVYAYTQVLAAVLAGIALGPVLVAIARPSRPGAEARARRVAGVAAASGAVAMAAIPILLATLLRAETLQIDLARGTSPTGAALLAALLVPPSACIAAVLPLLVVAAGGVRTSTSFGTLYAANTAGSVAGSLLAGFVLLPLAGSGGTASVVVAAGLTLAATALGAASARALLPVAAGAVACAVLLPLADLPLDLYRPRLPPGARVVEIAEGAGSDVLVADDADGRRRLWINSSWVAGTGGGHRLLGHLPALLVERPRAAVGIALGTGQTFAAALRHGFDELHCVEIDAGVIDLSRRHFRRANGGLFEQPQVSLHHEDGRAFLRATDRRFDLVVLEPLQAWSAGTSALYSREFYEEARRALAPGGVVAQWIPLYGQGVDETKAMVRTAADVFPEASLWLDDHDGILVLQAHPFRLSPALLAERVRARGIGSLLRENGVETPSDLLSLLLLGPTGIARWTAGAETITDDRPFLEFAAARRIGRGADFPTLLASLRAALDPIGGCAEDPADPAVEGATAIRDAVLAAAAEPLPDFERRAGILEAGLKAARSDLLRRRYRDVILRWAQTLSWQPDDQAAVYRRGLDHDPLLEEARVGLDRLAGRWPR